LVFAFGDRFCGVVVLFFFFSIFFFFARHWSRAFFFLCLRLCFRSFSLIFAHFSPIFPPLHLSQTIYVFFIFFFYVRSYDSEGNLIEDPEDSVPLTPEEIAERKLAAKKARKKRILKWRLEFGKKLDGAFYNVVMLLATVYALFAQDLLYLALPKSADGAWGVMTAICFGLFVLDLVLSCIGKPGYFASLFFWLDLLATISLLPDIPFVWEPFLESVGGDAETASSS
jgi:hypothetical protein